ncbi:hypothetical protein Acr_17g0004520 [Actinidia rufa]|uniref:Bifunctional inhibitor/lipid-transfer protein/seed storage 2S albumin superfamily protein n=1 Tax=Actinidia rufa TaxID=165716 RepID=A0A7J0G273_9ERIC|nr:hypothetical protein Acr_17g0004520 [Actinidia rufa]
MKRGSAIVLFFFACFGLWVSHGLASRDLKPDWSFGGGGSWGPGGASGGGCSSWGGCWTTPSPVTPSPPSSTPVSPTTPTPIQASPIQCGMGYVDMNACMVQYYASGGSYVSQECCTIMKETKQYCSYMNVNFFDVLENVCH